MAQLGAGASVRRPVPRADPYLLQEFPHETAHPARHACRWHDGTDQPRPRHGFAGDRMFISTLLIDDPNVADVASLPTFSALAQPNDGGGAPVSGTAAKLGVMRLWPLSGKDR
jgi:hypothetical protein